MNEFDYKTLLEKRWRHPLTAVEEASVRAWLTQHPESRADWDLETRLSETLEQLPDVPVPSNFTARVLQAIEREAPAPRHSPARTPWFMRLLLPRIAVAMVALGIFMVYHEHTATTARRAEVVRGVKVVSGVSSLPSPEILQDFDTIRQLPASTGPDPELIALMK
jgi:anti-sigma factor RsiW